MTTILSPTGKKSTQHVDLSCNHDLLMVVIVMVHPKPQILLWKAQGNCLISSNRGPHSHKGSLFVIQTVPWSLQTTQIVFAPKSTNPFVQIILGGMIWSQIIVSLVVMNMATPLNSIWTGIRLTSNHSIVSTFYCTLWPPSKDASDLLLPMIER